MTTATNQGVLIGSVKEIVAISFIDTPTPTGALTIDGYTPSTGELVLFAGNTPAVFYLANTTGAWTQWRQLSSFADGQRFLVTKSNSKNSYYIKSGTTIAPQFFNSVSCRAGSTPNQQITLSEIPDSYLTDNVLLEHGDVFCAYAQGAGASPDAKQNGIYIVNANGAWVRHPNFTTYQQLTNMSALIREGSQNAGYVFYSDNQNPNGVIDTDNIIIYKSIGNASAINTTDYLLSTGELTPNVTTSLNVTGYPNPEANPIYLPSDAITDDYVAIIHNAGNVRVNNIYLARQTGNLDLGAWGGITPQFRITNNGFYAVFFYQDYDQQVVGIFGDVTTGSAVITNVIPALNTQNTEGNYFINLTVGQKLKHNVLLDNFPDGATVQSFDRVANTITISANATKTATARVIEFIQYDYETNPAWVLKQFAFITNEVQGVTYVAGNGGSDLTGQINNFGQPFKTIQAGFNAMPSGDQLQVFPNGLVFYDEDLNIFSGAVGTEIYAIGDNVTNNGNLNINTASSISELSLTGIYWNDVTVLNNADNIDKIYYRNGAINNLTYDNLAGCVSGFANNQLFTGVYFVGNMNLFATGFAKQLGAITFEFDNCTWEAGGNSQVINLHGPNVTLFFRNCSGVPKTINFFDGATASQVIIDGIPPYAMCKTTVQTLTSAGGDIAFDNSLAQGGIVRLNSSTFQLPAGGTYNITATIVFTVNTVNSNMTFTTVRIGDTTSTLISNTWTGTNLHVGTWTATIQAVVVTPFQSSSATNIGSIGIAYTTDNDLSISANTGAIQITQIKY